MTIAIIKSGTNAEEADIADFAQNLVCAAIESLGSTFQLIDVDTMGFKNCIRERCTERVFDKNARFGCQKYDTCVEKNNQSVANWGAKKIGICDAHIFILQACNYSNPNDFMKLNIFLEELKGQKPADSLRGKRYFLIMLPGRKGRLYRHNTNANDIRILLSRLGMVELDSFVLDTSTGTYMTEAIPFAIGTLISKYATINRELTAHKVGVRFRDMKELSPDVLECLTHANVDTVGDLARKNGKEIFEILGQSYKRFSHLYVVYYENDIPQHLLNDAAEVAENFRRKELAEIRLELEKYGDTFQTIGMQLKQVEMELAKLREN